MKISTLKLQTQRFANILLLGATLTIPGLVNADTLFTISNTTADTFVSGANPGLNYGNAGTLAIAPAGSPKGEFDSVIKFNFASTIAQFNALYGVNQWQITGLTLYLSSNFGTNGSIPSNTLFNTIQSGNFGIDWLSGDNWVEGSGGGNGGTGFPGNSSVSFNSISNLFLAGSSSLGTFLYNPPGNNVYTNYALPLNTGLVSDAMNGGDVSLYLFAADSQISYLFNSRSFASGNPELVVSVIPEPTVISLAAMMATGLFLRRKKS
ncbi:MAG TPA: hypothetical protein VH255_07310 [Verrucomicrobiae bacterium]|nr:hypothetical protein [Verrucomicrobiae bacterium]